MSEQSGPDGGWASPGWTPPAQQPVPAPPAQPAQPYPAQPYPGQPLAGQQPPPPGGYAPTYYGAGWQAPVTPPPPRTRSRRARLALRVLAGAVVALVVAGIGVGVLTWHKTRPIGTVTSPTTVSARQLTTGHCLAALPSDGDVGSVRLVPCAQPHVAEVVGARDLDGTNWPGWSRVSQQLTAWCEMDTQQRSLGLRPVVWGPTEQGWGEGDRSGLCLAWSPDGALRGSFVEGGPVTNVEDEG